MWITAEGGFETISIAEPLEYFDAELLDWLRTLGDAQLSELCDAAATMSDRVFDELEAMNLPVDDSPQFAWQVLPDTIRFRAPHPRESVFDQIASIEVRWRLDAAMALEEGLSVLEDARSDDEGVV
jgi:hypothetical protein